MRALTLRQPWAYCVTHLGKRVENRTTKPPKGLLGTRIAIHAGLVLDEDASPPVDPPDTMAAVREIALQRGCIVATACIVALSMSAEGLRSLGYDARWFTGPVGIVLDDVRVLRDPILCRGKQGYWQVPPEVEARIVAHVGG